MMTTLQADILLWCLVCFVVLTVLGLTLALVFVVWDSWIIMRSQEREDNNVRMPGVSAFRDASTSWKCSTSTPWNSSSRKRDKSGRSRKRDRKTEVQEA